jgi:hypothetical protein
MKAKLNEHGELELFSGGHPDDLSASDVDPQYIDRMYEIEQKA